MPETTSPAHLLSSIAAQVADARTEAEANDLYFLARGVFYFECDALEDAGRDTADLRSAWSDVLGAYTERAEAKRERAYAGFVIFSDGTYYGGAR